MIQSLVKCVFDKTTKRLIGASRFNRETLDDKTVIDHYDTPKYFNPESHVMFDTGDFYLVEDVMLNDKGDGWRRTTQAEKDAIIAEVKAARTQRFLATEFGQSIIKTVQAAMTVNGVRRS